MRSVPQGRLNSQLKRPAVLQTKPPLANSRKPKRAPTIAAINQRLGILHPRGLNLITRSGSETPHRARTKLAQEKIPVTRLKSAVRQPPAIGRNRRIPRFPNRNEFQLVHASYACKAGTLLCHVSPKR